MEHGVIAPLGKYGSRDLPDRVKQLAAVEHVSAAVCADVSDGHSSKSLQCRASVEHPCETLASDRLRVDVPSLFKTCAFVEHLVAALRAHRRRPYVPEFLHARAEQEHLVQAGIAERDISRKNRQASAVLAEARASVEHLVATFGRSLGNVSEVDVTCVLDRRAIGEHVVAAVVSESCRGHCRG